MPSTDQPEFAFIGRSNVGKSSLINMLTRNKNLAKTSSKPGKTQLINHFSINNQWGLIDLPGYGFAKVHARKKSRFSDMILGYLKERRNMYCAFVLIDSRIPPQSIDLEFIEWCGLNDMPFQIIFTKADKLKKSQLAKNTATFDAALYKQGWEELPNRFISSSKDAAGRDEILNFIEALASIWLFKTS